MTDWLCLKRLGEDRRTSVAAISSIFKPTTGSGFGRQQDKHGLNYTSSMQWPKLLTKTGAKTPLSLIVTVIPMIETPD